MKNSISQQELQTANWNNYQQSKVCGKTKEQHEKRYFQLHEFQQLYSLPHTLHKIPTYQPIKSETLFHAITIEHHGAG